MALVNILPEVKFVLDEKRMGQEIKLKSVVTLGPKDGTWLKVVKR